MLATTSLLLCYVPAQPTTLHITLLPRALSGLNPPTPHCLRGQSSPLTQLGGNLSNWSKHHSHIEGLLKQSTGPRPQVWDGA